MPRYVTFFSYTGETWSRLLEQPGDRTAALRTTAQAVGATLESLDFMLGGHDGMVVVQAPDAVTVAAFVATALGSRALAAASTHELLTQDELVRALGTAAAGRSAFAPPGT